MPNIQNTIDYFSSDYQKSFFPLSTNEIVIKNAGEELYKYIYQKLLKDDDAQEYNFLPQIRCYSAKHDMHLRRTFKLNPVAEFFIYDFVYRNRKYFRKDFKRNRRSFGHRFEQGKPISLALAYREFKKSVAEANQDYKYCLKLDISAYFNSIYHHDLVQWFEQISKEPKESEYLGIFLRQINSGRSIDCLPQGIHPCKVIGSEFLKFIDNSIRLKCELLLRFMDDIYIFTNNNRVIYHDFLLIQQMAGEKGLNINSSKTKYGDPGILEISEKIEEVRKQLLRMRTEMISDYYESEEEPHNLTLSNEQEEYLYSLLNNSELEEADADLILTFMKENGKDVLDNIKIFLYKFPNLIKKIYYYSPFIDNKSDLLEIISEFLDEAEIVTEEQLFWITKIVEDGLRTTVEYSDLLIKIYEHKNSSTISKSKILEIPENRFGMPDLREEHLKEGKADWLSWASAVGSRCLPKSQRNYLLSYFGNVSPINYLIAETVKKL
ncbi:antiviral reverse transcriptase Drt5 [Crocosphaera sp.]|uniref:antiviral reverse transcriptase Drt5 n=1 Tax=Crocosphaera sp. TaxID=2729996 RepID=UPI002622C1AC|nr:antiviral reverse transcriptase Drt5 [Crocosphaera sp.]MDJ0580716.1 reverse transcriptase domain-containing protein [Crocosphaera sp.]